MYDDSSRELVVYRSGSAPAALNMAFDEAMLEQARRDSRGTTAAWLRLYRWSRPTVSFGRFQRPEARCCLETAQRLGVDTVRRPTGGKALLHDDEVTYCVVLPPTAPLARCSVEASHQQLAGAVAAALSAFGLEAEVARPAGSGAREGRVPCFAEHLAESVVVAGRKVAGSAQLRKYGSVLQHGSVLRSIDLHLHTKLFSQPSREETFRTDFEARVAGLEDLVAEPPSWDGLASAVIEAMAELVAGGRWSEHEPPPPLLERAEGLAAHKYSRLDWTAGGGAVA